MILLLLVHSLLWISSTSTSCTSAEVLEDCYEVSIWKHNLPIQESDTLVVDGEYEDCLSGSTHVVWNTKPYSPAADDKFSHQFLAAIIGLKAVDSGNLTQQTYCDSDMAKTMYNMSVTIYDGQLAQDNLEPTLQIPNVQKIDLSGAPMDFAALSEMSFGDMVNFVGYLLGQAGRYQDYYKSIPSVSVGPKDFIVHFDLLDQGDDQCFVEYAFYSCYVNDITLKLTIGLAIGGCCALVLVCCPIISCLIVCICCCCGKDKKQKR